VCRPVLGCIVLQICIGVIVMKRWDLGFGLDEMQKQNDYIQKQND
jgi:hypothetical protein